LSEDVLCSGCLVKTQIQQIPLIRNTRNQQVPDYRIFWIIRQDLYWPRFLQVIFITLLYFGCTTNQRSIPFGYFLHLLVQGYQGLLPCFLESSRLKKLTQYMFPPASSTLFTYLWIFWRH